MHATNAREVGDAIDLALDSEHHELSSQLAEVESAELAQINVALERMATGDYGVCAECGRNIPLARLTAIPYATHCTTCQRCRETATTTDDYVTRWGLPGTNLSQNGNSVGIS